MLRNEFLRYKNVPGLAIGHPAIIYDNVTDLCTPALSGNPRLCHVLLMLSSARCELLLLPLGCTGRCCCAVSSHVSHIMCV